MRGYLDGMLLASLSLLEGVEAERLEPIASNMHLRHADPGEVMGREGDAGETFGLVLEGVVEITRQSASGPSHLGFASKGAILGELAVLRRQPRMATLTAITPSLLAVGDSAVLAALLDIPEVHDRLQRVASTRLARDARPVTVSLRDGSMVLVRPLLEEDRREYELELNRLSRESRRRRFFSAGDLTPAMVDYLIQIDYVDHFAWVVLDRENPRRGLATARYVRQEHGQEAEIAFSTVDRHQGRGIATLLLAAIGVAAAEAGITKLIGNVLDENAPMRAVFAKVEHTTRYGEPGILVYEIAPLDAATLIEEETRAELAAAVHDVVTAASLALAVSHTHEQDLPTDDFTAPGSS
jgi:protein lysine acetyltransferase